MSVLTNGENFSTGGPPTAIYGILNNLPLIFGTSEQIMTIHGHCGFEGMQGVSVRDHKT